jgi:hypothetical protein
VRQMFHVKHLAGMASRAPWGTVTIEWHCLSAWSRSAVAERPIALRWLDGSDVGLPVVRIDPQFTLRPQRGAAQLGVGATLNGHREADIHVGLRLRPGDSGQGRIQG